MWTERARLPAVLLLAAALGCSEPPGEELETAAAAEEAPEAAPDGADLLGGRPLPPTALPDILRSLRENDAALPSPADGQGEATVAPADPVVAGSAGSWTLTYTAGPLGIAPGGAVVLQVSPFWGWSDPQTRLEDYPGYTTVRTDAPDVELEADSCGEGCLLVEVGERPLPPGGRLEIRYGGEGAGAAQVDRYAESREEFFFRIDGDGDGVTAPLPDPPGLEIVAGPARSLHVVVPPAAQLGEPVAVSVAALDGHWNAARAFVGEAHVEEAAGLEGLPERIAIRAQDGGAVRLAARAARVGRGRVVLRVPEWEAPQRSNPIEIHAESNAPRVFWVDLHGHSGLSDGTGTPDDYLRYARDVAALDAVALTDHDHWGLRFLDREPGLWSEIRDAVARFHEPRRFVTLLGFEWTSWIFGHRHVVYFADDGAVFGSSDPESDEPEELWALLRGQPPALTVAHHTGGGPIAVDWSVPPDPHFEPVVEISSVHGTSECFGCPSMLPSPVEGSFARDALARGYRLGLIGSGDTHDGHPGLGSPPDWLPGRTMGIAAVLAERLERAAILEALRERRVYATSGPRILLRFAVADAPMGGTARVEDPEKPRLVYVRAAGTAPIERVDLIVNGEVLLSVPGEGREVVEALAEDESRARDGDYVYARVIQEDGGLAWSSPVWIEVAGAP